MERGLLACIPAFDGTFLEKNDCQMSGLRLGRHLLVFTNIQMQPGNPRSNFWFFFEYSNQIST